MNTTLSLHCKQRLRQRGRHSLDINILDKYGEYNSGICLLTRRRAKATIIRLRRWLRQHTSPVVQKRADQIRTIVQRIEKLTDWMLIISPEGTAITIYRADKRRQKKFMRGKCRPVSCK